MPIDFDTAEFRRSDGPEFHGADAAWTAGSTGSGSIIAVIDSGIDTDSPEFAGRIHPASRDVAGSRGLDPEDNHGTHVSLIAAGARNNEGVVGIAFDSDLLAIRADLPGSCAGDSTDPELTCAFVDRDIAAGIELATDTGADVINLSLGGGGITPVVSNAVSRAAANGIVMIVSAGNSGDASDPNIDPAQPDPFAQAIRDAGGENVIIVGSVDDNGTKSTFSNRAGDFASSFLTARGERVCCVYEDGELLIETIDGDQFATLFSGTSFAAPQVSGAVALLAQAFPNLTGPEIVEILLETARDAGAPGVDRIYGRGILDIAAAFSPIGTTSLAGTGTKLALADDFAVGSPAMGDALAGATLETVVLDKYERAYRHQLGRRGRQSVPVQRLRAAIERGGITRAAGGDALAFAVTAAEGSRAGGLYWNGPLRLTPQEADGARVLAARVAARIAPGTQIGLALRQGARGLVGQLQDAERPAFAIAPSAGFDTGFFAMSDVAFAARHEIAGLGLTVSAERGEAWLGANRRADEIVHGVRERRPTDSIGLALDRRLGPLDAELALTWLGEGATLLGGHFHEASGIAGADSLFIDAALAGNIGPHWRIGGALRHGFTMPRGGGPLAGDSRLRTESWSLDLSRIGTFARGDRLGFRVSQPLRVAGGSVDFDLPVAWDYASESAILARQSLSLSPEGREVIGEFAWSAPFSLDAEGWTGPMAGSAAFSLFYRREPGHVAAAPADIGALVSVRASF